MSSRTLSTLRGHPVVVEFQYPADPGGGTSEPPGRSFSNSSSQISADFLPRLGLCASARLRSPSRQRLEVPSGLFPDPCSANSGSEIDSDVSSSPGIQSPSTTAALTCCPYEDFGEVGRLPIRMTFEFSSGLCVLRKRGRCQACSQKGPDGSCPTVKRCGAMEALVLRRHDDLFYELPKGHLEHGETLEEGAERELREETGLLNPVSIGEPLLSEIYAVRTLDGGRLEKTVHYFVATLLPSPETKASAGEKRPWTLAICDKANTDACRECADVCNENGAGAGLSEEPLEVAAVFGERETATKELVWVCLDDVARLFWKSNTVMRVLRMALARNS